MDHDLLSDRRRALENAFFARRDHELVQRMHDEHELLEATGVEDVALLRHLLELGITVDTLEAMAIIPLLFVAWADGRVDAGERREILAAAKEVGLEHGSSAYHMLEGWLEQPPTPALFKTWADYIGAVAGTLAPQMRVALHNEVLRVARAVANASGGFLLLGNRVSASQQKVLDRIEAAFHPE